MFKFNFKFFNNLWSKTFFESKETFTLKLLLKSSLDLIISNRMEFLCKNLNKLICSKLILEVRSKGLKFNLPLYVITLLLIFDLRDLNDSKLLLILYSLINLELRINKLFNP